MLNRLQKYRADKEQGFTLIELMVVILIIGILAAIAIPAFLNQRKSVNDAALQSDLRNTSAVVHSEGENKLKLGELEPSLTAGVLSKGSKWGKNNEKNILLSNGSKIKVSGKPNAYCITGWNSGSHHDEEPMNWDSVKGELLDDGVLHPGGACTTGDTTAPAPGGGSEGGSELADGELGWIQADGQIGYYPTHDTYASTPFTFHLNTATGENRVEVHDESMQFTDLHGQILFSGVVLNFAATGEANTVEHYSNSSGEFERGFPATWAANPNSMSIGMYEGLGWVDRYQPPVPTPEPIEEPTEEPTEEPIEEDILPSDSSSYDVKNAIHKKYVQINDFKNNVFGNADVYLFDDGYVKVVFLDNSMNQNASIGGAMVYFNDGSVTGSYSGKFGVHNGEGGFMLADQGEDVDWYEVESLSIYFG